MRKLHWTIIAAAVLATGLAPAFAQIPTLATDNVLNTVDPTTAPTPDQPPPCEIRTIAKGEMSGFGDNAPGFLGADLIIRDPDAWLACWEAHTSNLDVAPPPPPVDFRHDVVIAVVQGPQPSGGGPNIAILGVEHHGPFADIVVFDDGRPGPLDVITNPFHIVALPKPCLQGPMSVIFRHVTPRPETGVVIGTVFAAPPDADPRPLPGAHVILLTNDSAAEPLHAPTGGDGSYFFVNVPPGDYALRVEAEGFEPQVLPIHVPPNALVHRPVFLVPLPPPETGALAGLVVGLRPNGERIPLPNARVLLFNDNGTEPLVTSTNRVGFYIFREVPVGPYVARAVKPGWVPLEAPVDIYPNASTYHDFELLPAPPPTSVDATEATDAAELTAATAE